MPLVLLAELAVVLGGWHFVPEAAKSIASPIPAFESVTNTHAIGQILYTDYIYLFQAAGLVLLVGMIGAIVLTHRKRPGVRRQVINDQVGLKTEDVAEFKKVEIGGGV